MMNTTTRATDLAKAAGYELPPMQAFSADDKLVFGLAVLIARAEVRTERAAADVAELANDVSRDVRTGRVLRQLQQYGNALDAAIAELDAYRKTLDMTIRTIKEA